MKQLAIIFTDDLIVFIPESFASEVNKAREDKADIVINGERYSYYSFKRIIKAPSTELLDDLNESGKKEIQDRIDTHYQTKKCFPSDEEVKKWVEMKNDRRWN